MSSERRGLSVRNLSVRRGGTPLLSGIDLEIAPGEFVALMGRNGSGKTTLLRAIAGFQPIAEGSVRLDGRELRDVPVHRRGIGLLFQEAALFPGRTVEENIAYGLAIARRPTAEIRQRVERMLALLRLAPLRDRRPDALSGGERQRVALARTLAPGPALVLLDEPFASIDAELRTGLRSEFRAVLRALATSALLVTHDREEGLLLGDRVVLLDQGRTVANGPPMEVYAHPRIAATARFLGYNIVRFDGHLLAIDPRDLEVRTEGRGLPAAVEVAARLPSGTAATLRMENGEFVQFLGELPEDVQRPGRSVVLGWRRAIDLSDEDAADRSPTARTDPSEGP